MSVKKISFEEAKQLMDTVENLVIVDVREESEYNTGHAIGAELLSMSELTSDEGAARAAEVIPSKDTPLIVYCRSGVRSRKSARILSDFGYEEIYDVGGLSGWPYGLEY